MTVQEAKNRVIAIARGEVGYTESGVNRHKYAADMAEAYGWDVQGQPWCDIFVDWCFVKAFGLRLAARMTGQSVGSFSALCSASAARYMEKGAWNTIPEPGDQAFFRSGGEIGHTGLVETVSGLVVTVIEGNSSDAVARRSYLIGSSALAGFGRPDFSAAADAPDPDFSAAPGGPPSSSDPATASDPSAGAAVSRPPSPPSPSAKPAFHYHPHVYRVEISLLKKGDYGTQVERVQQLLSANGFTCGADGLFGDETSAALRAFQTAAGAEADGEWGAESFAAMRDFERREGEP